MQQHEDVFQQVADFLFFKCGGERGAQFYRLAYISMCTAQLSGPFIEL